MYKDCILAFIPQIMTYLNHKSHKLISSWVVTRSNLFPWLTQLVFKLHTLSRPENVLAVHGYIRDWPMCSQYPVTVWHGHSPTCEPKLTCDEWNSKVSRVGKVGYGTGYFSDIHWCGYKHLHWISRMKATSSTESVSVCPTDMVVIRSLSVVAL